MTPRWLTYFDYAQSDDPAEPPAQRHVLQLEKVYS
jgi:hypothetical protein